ncbi:baeRF2 domain-containing protein [Parasphingorhabdus pacifica]
MKLDFLQDLYGQPGPFATVYLDTSGDAEDAAKAIELRWRSAREQLSGQGADAATLQAIEDRIGEHDWRTGRHGQVIVATRGEVVFSDELPQPPTEFSDDELAQYGPLPHLMPYLRLRKAHVPYVVAVIDRIGADIRVANVSGETGATSVEGDDHPVHKARTGPEGSEQRHRNIVEEKREENASEVAQELGKQASRVGADMVVLAGDVQQRQLVRKQLSKGWQDRVVEIEAGHRDSNASKDTFEAELGEQIRAAIDGRVRETMQTFQRERGQHDRAVEGWRGTIGAFQREQAQTVLWTVFPGRAETEVPVGPSGGQIALDEQELSDMGVEQVSRVAASDAVVRAAATSNADLVLVDADSMELSEGVGAVLRYTDS